MPSPEPGATLLRQPARESSLPASREQSREPLQADQDPCQAVRCRLAPVVRSLSCSCSGLLQLASVLFDLHQRVVAVNGTRWLVEHTQSVFILVKGAGNKNSRQCQEAAERAKAMIDRRGLVTAVHHAVGAFRIARFGAVVLPLGGLHQLGKSIAVAALEQAKGLLPAKDVRCP